MLWMVGTLWSIWYLYVLRVSPSKWHSFWAFAMHSNTSKLTLLWAQKQIYATFLSLKWIKSNSVSAETSSNSNGLGHGLGTFQYELKVTSARLNQSKLPNDTIKIWILHFILFKEFNSFELKISSRLHSVKALRRCVDYPNKIMTDFNCVLAR